MAVRQEKDKTWTADFRYLDLIENKVKRYKKRGFKTKKEALHFEQDYTFKEKSTSSKFSVYLDEYLKSTDANLDTHDKKKNSIEKYAQSIYNMEYIRISKAIYIQWRSDLEKLELATSYKNNIMAYIKSVCKFAYKVYDLKDNSIVLQPFKKKYEEHKEMEVWTIEEFNTFISYVDNPIFVAYFTLLFYTGMRRSEAKALYKTDIAENRYVSITKSMRHGEDTLHVPKTKGSRRNIQIDEDTYQILEPLLKTDGKWLFGDDEPIGISSIQRKFDEAVKASGVKKIRIHDLRHSHATILINNGANIVAVSRRLGHSDVNMTLKVYTHLLEKTESDLMKIIENTKNGAKVVPNDKESTKKAD